MKVYLVNVCNSYDEWNTEKIFDSLEKAKKFCIDYVQNEQRYLSEEDKKEILEEIEDSTDCYGLYVEELLHVEVYDVE